MLLAKKIIYNVVWLAILIIIILNFSACQQVDSQPLNKALISEFKEVSERSIVIQYADIAHAVFEDALFTAQTLKVAITQLRSYPSETTLLAAKKAWKLARVPYMQSEVFRFGNAIVDDWEGQLNAWPLDEGLIDYIDQGSYEYVLGNNGANANLVANKKISVGTTVLDTSSLTPELIISLNELGGSESNVASGYHAIEFLLWGQDLNASNSGAGSRPASDFMMGKHCSNGHCGRRAQYLWAVSELLINDLSYMQKQWAPDGPYRKLLLTENPKQGLRKMLFGMGSLSLGELAGERMKVALEANSVEDEHDCFSDNTHYSHFYDAKGIQNIYLGEYTRIDGQKVFGPSLSQLVRRYHSGLDSRLSNALEETMKHFRRMVVAAESSQNPMAFDMMIAEGNTKGRMLVNQAINALVQQTTLIEQVAEALTLGELNPDNADHSF